MVALPTYNMKQFAEMIKDADRYPFYCVLLYTPMNGLDERMHNYVTSHWHFVNQLTGYNCLLIAVEDPFHNQEIQNFKPEDVYEIARYLGAPVSAMPCMVFFVNPQSRNDTLVLKLREFFPDPANVTDDQVTSFLRALQSIIDSCAERDSDIRLECLREGLVKEWPKDSQWAKAASKISTTGGWLVKSATTTSTVVEAIAKIVTTIAPFVG